MEEFESNYMHSVYAYIEAIESKILITYSQNSIDKINKSISSASSKATSTLVAVEADANKRNC